MDITEFADNVVLEFKDPEIKKNVYVYSTGDKDRFRVVRGISAKNHQFITTYSNRAELKSLWIDCVVNGYVVVSNKVFPKGIMECLPPKSLNIVVNDTIPVKDEIKDLYDKLEKVGFICEPPVCESSSI